MPDVSTWRQLRIGGAMAPMVLGVFALVAAPVAWSEDQPRIAALLLVLALVLIATAVLLIGRRPVILYLRRFGDEKAVDRFGSLPGDLVRYFRIVALSDPVTNPLDDTFAKNAGCLAGYVIVAAPLLALQALAQALLGSNLFPKGFGYLILVVVILPLGMRLGNRLTAWFRKRVTWTIATPADLDTAASRARRWRTRNVANFIIFRKIHRLGVANALWQETVLCLAAHVDAIVIDVSVAGPSLIWEIQTLRDAHPDRLILIASESSTDGELSGVLEGQTVLLAGKHFQRNLRRAIWTAAALRDPPRRAAIHSPS